MAELFTLSELRRNDGPGGRALVSILGAVYDVTSGLEDFFGPGKAYHVFAGRDCSYALALMSLKPEHVDVFDYASTDDDRLGLSEWMAYFDARYERVGWLVDREHPVSLGSLPPVEKRKKMGPVKYGGAPVQDQLDAKARWQQELEVAQASWKKEHGGSTSSTSSMSSSGSASATSTTATTTTTTPPPPPPPPPAAAFEPLSQLLFSRTKVLHTRVLRGAFMSDCIQGKVHKATYAKFVAMLYYIYSELEQQLDAQLDSSGASPKPPPPSSSSSSSSSAVVAAVDSPAELRRLGNLAEDLAFFYGPQWRDLVPGPSLATVRYVARIHDVGRDHPHRLVVHHWMRYGAGLAGGQFLRAPLTRALGLEAEGASTVLPGGRGVVAAKVPGLRYHQFDAVGDVEAFYRSYMGALDRIGSMGAGGLLTGTQREEMIDEAKVAFQLNLDLNDEMEEAHGGAAAAAAKL